jgi:hypothetical protein
VTDALSPLAATLLRAITAGRRARTPIDDLRAAAQDADQSMLGDPDARERLLAAITELADAGLALLPARGGALWQRSPRPALPRWVAVPQQERPAPAAPAPDTAWHAQLSWVPELISHDRPTPGELELLHAVQRFLAAGEPRRTVPLRERSWQLLGDEKALDRFVRGRLFGPARLSLELVGARVVLPQPTATVVGSGPVTLVVENFTTYASLAAALPAAGTVGRVVWGAGNQLSTVLAALADEAGRTGAPIAELRYFGDLDTRGLEIAADGARRCADLGLPPLLSAHQLYVALVETGPVRPPAGRVPATELLEWLPEGLRGPARAVLERGRIAQEAVGAEVLDGLDLTAL